MGPNKVKVNSDTAKNRGGVQTNEINAVVDDELSSEAEEAEMESVDGISVTESETDNDGSEAA